MERYTKDKLPQGEWSKASHTAIVRYQKIDGPFQVVTANGAASCADGYLALDFRGFPYPIDAEEFKEAYEDYPSTARDPRSSLDGAQGTRSSLDGAQGTQSSIPAPTPSTNDEPDAKSPEPETKPGRKPYWK